MDVMEVLSMPDKKSTTTEQDGATLGANKDRDHKAIYALRKERALALGYPSYNAYRLRNKRIAQPATTDNREVW
jgi:hypothetical protein